MCGRYAIFLPPHKLKDLFGTENLPNFPPRYNAAPLQEMPAIIRHRMGLARWGFLPPWAAGDEGKEDRALASKMINARSETVMDKPAFREAWAKGRRCLVPANGFFEWKKDQERGVNQPYYIHHKNDSCIALAGLWVKFGDVVTFTILTKDADGDIADLHHRSPVMIAPDQAQDWFQTSPGQALALIKASSARDMIYHAVDTKVGKVANDSEELIEEIKIHREAALPI